MREVLVGTYYKEEPNLGVSMYKISSKKAREYALNMGRELAEGPTVMYLDNYYGPVELWPLVWTGGD